MTATPPRSKSLAPAPGVTPAPAQASPHRFLSDELTARRHVSPEAMRIALQASLLGRSLTEILVADGDLSEDDLARTLAVHHRLDHVDLERFDVDRDAAALIEPDIARRLGAVPIAFLPSGTVVVALYEPNGSTAVVELAKLTARTIQPAVASRSQIETLIESLRRRVIASPASSDGAAASAAHPPRALPSRNIVVSSRGQSEESRRPAIAPSVAGAARRPLGDHKLAIQVEGSIGATRERAELAERRRREAEDRARSAQERARNAEARARLAEARAQAAEQRVDAAEERAEDATVAIEAANKALARLLRACEILDRHVSPSLQPPIAGAPDRPAATQADAPEATDAAMLATDIAAKVAGEHPRAVAAKAPDGSGADAENVVPEGLGAGVTAAGDGPVPDVPDASKGASGAEGDSHGGARAEGDWEGATGAHDDATGPGQHDEPAANAGRRDFLGRRRGG